MLVVSRKRNQTINFPNLGISIEVLRISGNAVSVGVDAPREVRILRGELLDEQAVANLSDADREARHAFRNKVHTANLALHLLQKQLEVGRPEAAEATLTRVLETLSDLESCAVPQPLPTNEESPANGRRALVVEDNANERELLAGYLRLCGYEVDSVEDGLAAMMYLSTHDRPDLVLLDMQMPRMDGAKTISAIRRNPAYRGIKLFAVSGMTRNEMQVPLGQRGVDRWFSKPLRPAEFAHELQTEVEAACPGEEKPHATVLPK